jgi:hypothetical protein
MEGLTSRPSPAIVVAVVALIAALAGTAVAGPDASTSAINKKKVKKIASKQIKKLAPDLSVASANQAANAAALGGQPPSAFERAGRITRGIVSGSSPVGTRILRDPRTGADVRMAAVDGRIQIINTSASRRMTVAGVATSGSGNPVEARASDLAPGGDASFSYPAAPTSYLDLVMTVGGPNASETRFSHLTCSGLNGSGGFPSMVSCVAVG